MMRAGGSLFDFGRKVALARADDLTEKISSLLPKRFDGRFLDFGCGVGWLGNSISRQIRGSLTSLDIRTYPLTDPEVHVEVYEGERIPYGDDFFDLAVAAFCLHHSNDADNSLNEISRVTNGQIIVLEDLVHSNSEKLWNGIKDVFVGCFLEPLTFRYRCPNQWEEAFSSHGLEIQERIYFSSKIGLLHFNHVGWLLRKTH